jgi:hypothetical protein
MPEEGRCGASPTSPPRSTEDVTSDLLFDHPRLALNMDVERMVFGRSGDGKSLHKNAIGIARAGVTVTIAGARKEAGEVPIVAVYTHADTSLGKSTS